jgi:hypothetical protein
MPVATRALRFLDGAASGTEVSAGSVATSGGAASPCGAKTGAVARTPGRARAVLPLCAAVALLAGCAASRPLPPRPALPAVRFVPPCDPQATVGLTAEGVEQLRARDTAWHQYVDSLERIIRGAQ